MLANIKPWQKWMFAIVLAAGLHLLLFAIKLSLSESSIDPQPTIQMTLLNEPDKLVVPPEQNLPQTTPVQQEIVDEPTPTKITPVPEDILVAPPDVERKREDAINIDVTSDKFQQFLKSETDSYRRDNPGSVETFGETFIEPGKKSEVISIDKKEARNQIRALGVFATEDKKGKRTCYGQIFDMLDISGSASYPVKDCTPKQKFDLKMNKPNNG